MSSIPHASHSLDARIARAMAALGRAPEDDRAPGIELLREARELNRAGAVIAALHLVASEALAEGDFHAARDHASEAAELARAGSDRAAEAAALALWADALQKISGESEARELYDRSLAMAREAGERRIEAAALCGLGTLCGDSGAYRESLDHYGRALELATAIGAEDLLARALLGIGNARESMAQYPAALEAFQEALEVATQIGHARFRAYATGNIGVIHERTGDISTALYYEIRSMELKERLGDRWALGVSYNNIGLIYQGIGNYARATEYLLRALECAERIGDRSGEMIALHNIGCLYEILGQHSRVLDHYQRMLAIAREIGERKGEAFAHGDIGRFHGLLGDNRQALLHLLRGLKMHREIGDRFGEHGALEDIAEVYLAQGDIPRAISYAEDAVALAEEIGDRRGVIASLVRLGKASSLSGDHRRAIDLLDRALRSAREGGYGGDLTTVTRALAEAHLAAGDPVRHRKYERIYHEYVREAFDGERTLRTKQLIAGFERRAILRRAESLGLAAEDLDILLEMEEPAEPGEVADEEPAERSPAIAVQTFGDLRVTVDGRQLRTSDWGRRKARDLFKFLLLHHRRVVTIDEIMEKLWDGAADRSTELLVMNAVSRIRRALEPEREPRDRNALLSSVDRTYRLDLGDDADIDYMRFKELVVLARRAANARQRREYYEEAIPIYTDDFLKEDYAEEWTAAERELLKDAFLESLEYVAGEQLRAGRYEEAAAAARRILAADPTSERAAEILLESLVARGRAADALQAYNECRAAFRRDLAIDPPETLRRIVMSLSAEPVSE